MKTNGKRSSTGRSGNGPWPPRDHAARIRISGLPALLDRGLREIDVPRKALAVERGGIDLHNMHHSSTAVSGELPSLRRVSLFFGEHAEEFANDMTHLVKLGLAR